MTFRRVTNLRIVGVFDRGEPNKERVVLKVRSMCNLGKYAVLVTRSRGDEIVPGPSRYLWLPDRNAEPGSYVVVYTGPGELREGTMRNSGAPALVLHWQSNRVLFSDPEVIPAIIRIERLAY